LKSRGSLFELSIEVTPELIEETKVEEEKVAVPMVTSHTYYPRIQSNTGQTSYPWSNKKKSIKLM